MNQEEREEYAREDIRDSMDNLLRFWRNPAHYTRKWNFAHGSRLVEAEVETELMKKVRVDIDYFTEKFKPHKY